MKILVVEDEPKTGTYLKQGLVEAGFMVDLATNGVDGLNLASTESYDLAILDVMLPGIDGWQVLQGMRRAGKEMPVLFLTARDQVEDRVKGLELGADDAPVGSIALPEELALARPDDKEISPLVGCNDRGNLSGRAVSDSKHFASRGSAFVVTPREDLVGSPPVVLIGAPGNDELAGAGRSDPDGPRGRHGRGALDQDLIPDSPRLVEALHSGRVERGPGVASILEFLAHDEFARAGHRKTVGSVEPVAHKPSGPDRKLTPHRLASRIEALTCAAGLT